MLPDRGFTLAHQKVALELAFRGVAAGYTELTINPTSAALRHIYLNARRAKIARVDCNGHQASFEYLDTLASHAMTDVHAYPHVKRAIYSSMSQMAQGELCIQLPDAVRPEVLHGEQGGEEGFAPIVVHIDYMVDDVHEAMQTVLPTNDAPYRVPHMYTRPTGPDSARCWVPCVDTLWDRCTWELEFVVPRRIDTTDDALRTAALDPDEEEEEEARGTQVYVICSGELTEHAVHPHNPEKSIFYYTQAVATSVQHIAFCAGPFVLERISPKNTDADTCEVLAFCLPEHEHELRNTVGFTWQAIEYISSEYGSFPFNSFKMVFVDNTLVDCNTASTLAVCSSDLLHPASVIDQAFENRHILSNAVAFQWVGINIIQKTWADTWLIHGLSQHLASMFLRRLLGNNDYRFRMKKDCDRLCAWDIGMPPLYQVGRDEPPDEQLLPFFNLKAPLVLYLLDRRLCKMGASLGLGRVIPKVFLQAITGEMSNIALGTHGFLRTCKKVSGADLRLFVDQWINGSGCPRFICTATFNRKKLLIEMHVRQESPAYIYAQQSPENALLSNPVPLWEGQMTVRIHEADGTPYEHVLDIKNEHQRYDVPFNTKYKRVRRNTKRFQARQAAAAAAAAGDEDAAEAIGMIDLGFGLGMWEDEEERKRWKVADWTEEDEAIMATAPYEWIRLDADFEWMAQIQFEQPDYMWVSQLQRDRDVVAQLTAVTALSQMPSLITSSMLTRTVLVTKYFYRIRAEAALGLANCALPHLELLGLFHLLMLFRTSYCFDLPYGPGNTALDAPCIPKPNDYSDKADYFVRRALIHAIARVRDQHGKVLPIVQRFLINLLKYNDNSTNKFVDDYYVASIINALASALIPADIGTLSVRTPGVDDVYSAEELALREKAVQEVERLQELDRLVPSFHNVVSLASMDFQLALTFANLRPINLNLFMEYTREGNFTPVRIGAFNALLLLHGLQHKVLARYYFSVLTSDENDRVKLHIARGLCDALAVAISTGELGYSKQRTEPLDALQEGENETPMDIVGKQDILRAEEDAFYDSMIRFLRREIGRSASVREGFLAAFSTARDQPLVRSALLHLAELLFKPAEESRLPVERTAPQAADEVSGPAAVEHTGAMRIKLMIKNAPQAPAPPKNNGKAQALRVVLPKAPKPKKVNPGLALGMTSSDLTACRNCINKLLDNPHCDPFIRPVDPVRDEAPDYFEVIKEPMDLSSVSNKLESGQYKDRFAFKDDVELIFKNAKTYTPDPKAWIHYEASRSESTFRRTWNRITKTLELAAARAAVRQAEQDADAKTMDEAEDAADDSPDEEAAPKRVLKIKGGAKAEASADATKRRTIKLSIGGKRATESQDMQETEVKRPKADTAKTLTSPAAAAEAESVATDVPLAGEMDVPLQMKKVRAVLQAIKKTKEAAIFLRPIDPVLDGAPTYYDEIKHPMDLGTMERKLNEGAYNVMGDFAADMRCMLANCRQFNPPGTIPAQMEAAVARIWRREWSRAMVRKLDHKDKRAFQAMISRLKQQPSSALFLYAVDPVALGIPHYFDVVPKENARDLTLIGEKLRADKYESIDALDADIRLMLTNAYTFNAHDARVVEVIQAFERVAGAEVPELEVAVTYPDSPSSLVSNGMLNRVVFSVVEVNEAGRNAVIESITGAFLNPSKKDGHKSRVLRNMTTARVQRLSLANQGEPMQIPYDFYSEVKPEEVEIEFRFNLEDADAKKHNVLVHQGMVTVVEPKHSLLDIELLLVFILIASVVGGIIYLIYPSVIVPLLKRNNYLPRKDFRPKPVARSSGADNIEEWLPQKQNKKKK
ncbi:hypothetical protein MVES_002777 [Malassezia vespertilionis]|uniref:Transcription initiation factor TFIID subunit 2 n=1 Tax=Malassezia vespertilionis TaxID=2020962 RepID=A0A2N1J8Y1_9BASI|nr:hypothetical protein MVES_002777 [Malassezia vespertilionis]